MPGDPALAAAAIREEAVHDRTLMYASQLLLLWVFAAQVLLVWWKKHRPSQYFLFSLAGLATIPVAAAAYLGNWRFVATCALFGAHTAYTLRLAAARPLRPDTPQYLYRSFLVMHRITFALATFGFFSLMLTILVVIPLLDTPLPVVVTDEVLAIFYGGYFGVVQRDLAQVISERMARNIGVAGREPGSASAQGGPAPATPARKLPNNTCALCGHELRTLEALEIGRDARAAGSERKLWKLSCGHELHEECVRGWSVIGKRSMCPYCGEKVDTENIFASSPWEKQSPTWFEFLDLIRMSLVWNPLIFVSVRGAWWVVDTYW